MLSSTDIVALLQKNDAFAAAPETVLAELASGIDEQGVEPDTVVIQKGVRCGDLFIVVDGEFGVFIEADEPPVARLTVGRIFGEIGAVSGIEATATVKAMTEGSVLAIKGPLLHQAMRHSPSFAEALLRSLSRYIGTR